MDTNYGVYVLDKYLLMHPDNMKTETFSCDQYYGIIFFYEGGRTQVLHNKDMGDRLIINMDDGSWQDIPFKSATFSFLPEEITVLELG